MLNFSKEQAVGNERFLADKRQVAGLLTIISVTVTFFPLARLAPLINGDGGTADSGIDLAKLIGNLIAVTMGLMGMTVGYLSLIHDYSNSALTGALVLFENLALIPYVTDIWAIGKAANTGSAFIPAVFEPTETDVWVIGAMGMVGAGTFCLFLFGSLAFLAISHQAYEAGNPHTSGYYRCRLVFYSFVMTLAGGAQLTFGSYILSKFGDGPLEANISVAMFHCFFPEINIFVGSLYVLNGIYGMLRGSFMNPTDNIFQGSMWLQYLCTLVLMILVQVTYAPGAALGPAAPTIANLTLGVHIMPAYLDYMSRKMPQEFTSDYYEIDGHSSKSASADDDYDGDDYEEEGAEEQAFVDEDKA